MSATGGSWGQKPSDEPVNHGNKVSASRAPLPPPLPLLSNFSLLPSVQEHPLGHHDCLSGLTFVITGILDSMRRDEAEGYIKRHGGRVTGSVSKKTSFLLVGMECGNSKTSKAKHSFCFMPVPHP